MKYKDWRARQMKDPEFRRLMDEPGDDPYLEIAWRLLQLRKKAGLTQRRVAELAGTSQQAIARLESMDYRGYSLTTLKRLADVFHKKLRVQFV